MIFLHDKFTSHTSWKRGCIDDNLIFLAISNTFENRHRNYFFHKFTKKLLRKYFLSS